MAYEDTLSHVPLLAHLNKEELQALAKGCREGQFSAGTTLTSQGDTGVGLYILTSGRVRITQTQSPGGVEEEPGTAIAGDVLGEMALLDDLPRSATLTATDDVTALLLPVWGFRSTLQRHPDIALKLLTVLSRCLRQAENRLYD
jgi:CRP/FNR family cyclic AMP-dependent transcriptional regulator